MKTLILITLLFLSACNTPQVRDLPQKNLQLVFEIDDETGRRYINEEKSSCFYRHYRHSQDYLGPIGQEGELDVAECNDMIGYSPDEYVELSDYFEAVRRLLNKQLNKMKNK